jgi:hypothetical protein
MYGATYIRRGKWVLRSRQRLRCGKKKKEEEANSTFPDAKELPKVKGGKERKRRGEGSGERPGRRQRRRRLATGVVGLGGGAEPAPLLA